MGVAVAASMVAVEEEGTVNPDLLRVRCPLSFQ
jgi:hypothetical protein